MEATRQRMETREREQETQRRQVSVADTLAVLWALTEECSQETAVASRTLYRRIRIRLQLQLRRKEQINRILRKGLISLRKQLGLKTTQVAVSYRRHLHR